MLSGGPVTLTNLDTQIKSLATKATAVNTSLASVMGPLVFGSSSIGKSDNCTFIKYSLLSINSGLPEQQDTFQTIILLGLGVTSALMFINLTNCMMGQFRLADDKYYKEWEDMKKAEAAQSNLTESKKPESATKELPKLVSSVVVSSNMDSKTALQPAPISGQVTDRMSSIITEEKEKSNKVIPPKRDSVRVQPSQAINKVGPTVVGPRRIKPSSVAYGANFFAPKPVAKVKVIKAAEVEQALDDLRADNVPKTNKINEVDEAAVERIRNAGLFGEISRPLRPLK